MMDQIIRVAWDLNDNTDNRYQLVYEIAELAKKFRAVADVEKRHEERYRSLLKNEDARKKLENSSVKIWECLKCGHIVVGPSAPEYCSVCDEYNCYFEIREDNYDLIRTWG